MKKAYITFLLVVASMAIGFAQSGIDWKWTIANGTIGSEDVAESKVDKQGNVVFGGRFSNNVIFSNNPSISLISGGSTDAFVAKTDGNGNFLWVKWMSGPAQDYVDAIDVDKDGNVLVLADFYDSIDYKPGATGNHVFYSNPGLSNILLAKYDPSGILLWAKNIGGISIDKGSDVSVDTLGNIFVTGYFYKTANFNAGVSTSDTLRSRGAGDIFLAKYDPNGVYQWVKQIGSTGYESPSHLTIDKKNNVYLSAAYTAWLDVNPSPSDSMFLDTTSWGSNVFIEKFDNDGNYQWVNAMTSVGFKSIGEMATDDQSRLYVCGRFNGTTNFNSEFGYDTLYALPGNSSIYFGVYNSNGSLAWMKKIEHGYQGGQDAGTAIAIDAKKDIYITGQFWGQGIDFNTSLTDTFLLGSNSSNNYDAFLAKYSNTGNFKWAYNIGEAGSDVGVSMSFDNTGSLYFSANVANSTSGSALPIDFDIDPIATYYYTPAGGTDFSITKYDQCILDDAAAVTSAGITAFQNQVQYQWVNCGIGYAPIAGATTQTFLPTITGNYACILTSSATCRDTTNCYFFDACANFTNSVTLSNTGILTSSVANASSYQWLSCDSNGTFTVIVGATSQSFTPTQNGSYACKAVKGGCTDTSSCKQVTNVGLRDYSENNSLRFYPNPAKNNLTVEAENLVSVHVVDLIGQQVRTTQTSRSTITIISVEQLPAGVYFISCKFENGKNITRKFIKE